MSDLRKQLQSLRDDYRTDKYPGDLAAEILTPPPRRLPVGKIIVAAAALTALAAAVAVWVSIEPAVVAPVPTVEVATTEQIPGGDAEAVVAAVPVHDMGAMPEFPDDLPLVPSAIPLVPEGESITDLGSMPEMPSMDMSFSFDS